MSISSALPTSWTEYVKDPTWLPHAYEEHTRSLQFVRLAREDQRAAPFLDPRCLTQAPLSAPALLTQLPPYAIEKASRPLHFIFHTAFCCSTLLTRALDIPGVSMGLKEPFVLVGFSVMSPAARESELAKAALRMSINLLSRPLAPGETQIVKPSNVANVLADQILEMHPDSKALILHSSLPEFLRSLTKQGLQGRLFGRQLFQRFAPSIPLHTYNDRELLEQADLQIAAQAWLMQARSLSMVAHRFGRDRVRTLSADALLADKAGALERIGAFFELDVQEETWREIAAGPGFARNSKRPGEAFDAAARSAGQLAAGQAHAEEIAIVVKWAEIVASRSGAPLNLGDTLLQGIMQRS